MSPSTSHIFISYAREDEEVMKRVVSFLRSRRVKVWVDNEKLRAGTKAWEQEVERAINGASAVVTLLSPDAKDSDWVLREIIWADEKKKPIFPILVRGDANTAVPIRLVSYQRIDLRKDELSGLNALLEALIQQAGNEIISPEKAVHTENTPPVQITAAPEKNFPAPKPSEQVASNRIAFTPKSKENKPRFEASSLQKPELNGNLKKTSTGTSLNLATDYLAKARERRNKAGLPAPETTSAPYSSSSSGIDFSRLPAFLLFVATVIVFSFVVNWICYGIFTRFGYKLPEINMQWLALLISSGLWASGIGFTLILDEYSLSETSVLVGAALLIGVLFLIGLGLVYAICYGINYYLGFSFGTTFYWVFGIANAAAFMSLLNQ